MTFAAVVERRSDDMQLPELVPPGALPGAVPARRVASQGDRAYMEIRARIVEGRYRPRRHLSEPMLARLHRMSRTPVREALSRLLEEGYLSRIVGRGYFVAEITTAGVRDLFDVRRLIESETAARAAEVARRSEVERIRDSAETPPVADLNSLSRAQALNMTFHLAIASASHNVLLNDLLKQCLTHWHRFMVLDGVPTPSWRPALRDHLAIADAIAARDGDGARRLMEHHLAVASDAVIRSALARDHHARLD